MPLRVNPRWKYGDKWLNATQVALLLSVSRNSLKGLMRDPFHPLPSPFPFGKSKRWLASQIWDWMEQRMSLALISGEAGETGQIDAPQVNTSGSDDLKQLYESGMTVDEICRAKKMGKARALAMLRESGATVRKPGRRAANMTTKRPESERRPHVN